MIVKLSVYGACEPMGVYGVYVDVCLQCITESKCPATRFRAIWFIFDKWNIVQNLNR